MDSTSRVVLPYELERQIFELVARESRTDAVVCSTVCRYVQEWIETILYDTIILDFIIAGTSFAHFLPTLQARPPSFFGKRVKHIHILSSTALEDVKALISACSGLVSLTCWSDAFQEGGLLSVLPTQTLQKLSIKIETLLGITEVNYPKLPAGNFPNLTHLELVNPAKADAIDWDGLCRLPSLTHLAVGDLVGRGHAHSFLPPLAEVLEKSPRLQLLLIITEDEPFKEEIRKGALHDGEEVDVQSKRVLCIPYFHWPVGYTEYWKDVRAEGKDMWAYVEDVRGQVAREVQDVLAHD